jgi:ketosteroid isomerase-like protein
MPNTAQMEERITDGELSEFVQRAEEAADAWVRGDMDRYLALISHARGFTLLAPFGGPATRHEQRADELNASAGYFKGGEARLEHVETHAWGDTLVLVMIERQYGQVGGLPDQDLSLRVTHVYRRDGADWLLVHRHADPLVHPLELAEVAALARR